EAWEQRKLEEVADIVGGGTPSTSNPNYWDGDIDWYAPAEIDNQIYVKSSKRKITEEGFNKSSASMLPIGTVLFTSRAGIGKTAILSKEGCTNQGFQSIVPHQNKLHSYFIFSRTEELKRYGERVGAGSTFVEISGKQMAKMQLMMPKTMEEQEKIGAFFRQLDHLITLHQRKYDLLIKTKKGFLQKMFPKDGEDKPEIRFAGFTDSWEQRKFSKLVNRVSKSSEEPNIPRIEYEDIVSGQGVFNKDIFKKISDKKGIEFQTGDVLFGKLRPYLQNWFLANFHGIGVGDWWVLRPSETDSKFIYSLIQTNQYQVVANLSTGTKMPRSDWNVVSQTEFYIPINFEEQSKIGSFFANLDTLITLHQRELNSLKDIKKSLLQQMFV
ncbi:MAG: restriction endonuclease subunit S, partial [Clostridiaceae bacterium]|nr:restriction endonuclease subunit S [Clostridiaceae bacterium]